MSPKITKRNISDLINLVKIYLSSDFVDFFRYSFKLCESTKNDNTDKGKSNEKKKTKTQQNIKTTDGHPDQILVHDRLLQ